MGYMSKKLRQYRKRMQLLSFGKCLLEEILDAGKDCYLKPVDTKSF